ncbi:aminoglycoside phosphotransferase family enzyme [Thermosporothrix hazakensis]|jgi:aminoglycoside phosphotransferase family enzyme|uniref:Aminoglycoside phosphotransferase family enzyme n=1 Tax=Thermosporothrix hazakensis TaxID=644383 RepID=A0A326UFM7_THEHA|nr:phosphotransferase [Thermosporothrix hazakensis]PZW36661.1 aminoglycoside phosphotransferase family enzyme [Thermosporothrix hazakensis]GCE47312.1 hypothetical protein KTH_21810 [Thermosporothrix hazakensis]
MKCEKIEVLADTPISKVIQIDYKGELRVIKYNKGPQLYESLKIYIPSRGHHVDRTYMYTFFDNTTLLERGKDSDPGNITAAPELIGPDANTPSTLRNKFPGKEFKINLVEDDGRYTGEPLYNRAIEHGDIALYSLLDGLKFNRKNAPIYIGVVQFYETDTHILLGKHIVHPDFNKLNNDGYRYAVLMHYIPKANWLNHYLSQESFVFDMSNLSMLIHQIARHHQGLDPAPTRFGTIWQLYSKFQSNLGALRSAHLPIDIVNPSSLNQIADTMEKALRVYKSSFEERQKNGQIRRCHGDLKANNLFTQNNSSGFRVYIIDAIDFNEDFFYIDLLSDLAMLLVEIFFYYPSSNERRHHCILQLIAQYCQDSGEIMEKILPIIFYYLVEKALVRTYTSYSYDHQSPDVVHRYFDIAQWYTGKLHLYI